MQVTIHRIGFIDRKRHRVLHFTPPLKVYVRVCHRGPVTWYEWSCPVTDWAHATTHRSRIRHKICDGILFQLYMYKQKHYGPLVAWFKAGKCHETVKGFTRRGKP